MIDHATLIYDTSSHQYWEWNSNDDYLLQVLNSEMRVHELGGGARNSNNRNDPYIRDHKGLAVTPSDRWIVSDDAISSGKHKNNNNKRRGESSI